MVDIQCTRCGATGTGYETNYVAKFTLKHETGCGAKIGVPKYTDGIIKSLQTKESEASIDIDKGDLSTVTEKSKKKKAKKKVKQTIIQDLS